MRMDPWRPRNLIIMGACFLLLLVSFTARPSVDMERVKNVIHRPTDDTSNSGTDPDTSEPKTGTNVDAEVGSGTQLESSPVPDSTSTTGSSDTAKISKFHLLVPASDTNVKLCYNLVSNAVNRFPVPTLLGYNGTGLYDAKATHLAKLRAIQDYFDAMPSDDDDDLALIIDGYDIIMQLPADTMIERYFNIRDRADERLAKQLGLTVKEAHAKDIRQTIFWGPDKLCWPFGWELPRCWAVPESTLGDMAFGPKTGNGDMPYNDPRWLNSGTVIGPVGDLRAYVTETMKELDATYDPEYEFSESDQLYFSNVWGRQEYYRLKMASEDGEVERSGDRVEPGLRVEGQETEFHVAVEYESELFQTKAGYEPFFGYLQFNQTGLEAEMNIDMFDEGGDFEPYNIEMPANVASSLTRLYDTVPESYTNGTAAEWLRTVNLGVNYVTKAIYGLWHCTAAKEPIYGEYPLFWWYPFAEPLMKAAIKADHDDELIIPYPVDGRKWAPKNRYPKGKEMQDELGGVWTDLDGNTFVPWDDLCGVDYDVLFAATQSTS